MAAKAKPEPRRVRLTVPAADESTQRWLDLQDDQSVSMRLLIRESIERDGYIDVMNKPVEQLPRRGRPPLSEQTAPESRKSSQTGSAEAGSAASEEHPAGADESVPVAAVDQEAVQTDEAAGERSKQVEKAMPAGKTDQVPESEQTNAETQFDMDDIFGHRG